MGSFLIKYDRLLPHHLTRRRSISDRPLTLSPTFAAHHAEAYATSAVGRAWSPGCVDERCRVVRTTSPTHWRPRAAAHFPASGFAQSRWGSSGRRPTHFPDRLLRPTAACRPPRSTASGVRAEGGVYGCGVPGSAWVPRRAVLFCLPDARVWRCCALGGDQQV